MPLSFNEKERLYVDWTTNAIQRGYAMESTRTIYWGTLALVGVVDIESVDFQPVLVAIPGRLCADESDHIP